MFKGISFQCKLIQQYSIYVTILTKPIIEMKLTFIFALFVCLIHTPSSWMENTGGTTSSSHTPDPRANTGGTTPSSWSEYFDKQAKENPLVSVTAVARVA